MNVAEATVGEPPNDPPGNPPAEGPAGLSGGHLLPRMISVAIIAALVIGGAFWSTHRIQNDLTTRAQAALALVDLPVTVRYHGLDAVLTGSVAQAQDGADAIGTVMSVSGTRHVTSQLTVVSGGDLSPAPVPQPNTDSPQPNTTPNGTGGDATAMPSGKITFDMNDATLSDTTKAYLDRVASYLLDHPQVVVAVRGHSDSSGPDDFNWAISKHRAAAVVAYLVAHQVPEQRLHPAAFAATSPVASNDTPDGRAANRRVELVPEETP